MDSNNEIHENLSPSKLNTQTVHIYFNNAHLSNTFAVHMEINLDAVVPAAVYGTSVHVLYM